MPSLLDLPFQASNIRRLFFFVVRIKKMKLRRWVLTGLLLSSLSFSTQAKLYSTPILGEASDLLQTNPEQSLVITQRYLSQRRLSEPSEQSRVHTNNEVDHTIRTPLNTINAIQIEAQAYSELNQPQKAISRIKEAEKMAEKKWLNLLGF